MQIVNIETVIDVLRLVIGECQSRTSQLTGGLKPSSYAQVASDASRLLRELESADSRAVVAEPRRPTQEAVHRLVNEVEALLQMETAKDDPSRLSDLGLILACCNACLRNILRD